MQDRDHSLRDGCAHRVSYDLPRTHSAALAEFAAYARAQNLEGAGDSELVALLEERVRRIVGHEAALFMPSGKAAQNIALRVWCDGRQSRTVGLHPLSHTERWEERAYAHLFGLQSVEFGSPDQQTSLADVERLPDGLGAASIELALRPLGCALIPWEELTAIHNRLRARGIPLHGDCARLWESGPAYGRTYAEIAEHFDSVYVSLYKALGGMAGAVLAGPSRLIEAAKPWQLRMGHRLHNTAPYVLAALKGLDERLPLMGSFHAKAVALAHVAEQCEGISVSPAPPHTNAFLLTVRGNGRNAEEARREVAEAMGLWLYDYAPQVSAQRVVFEVHVWTAALSLPGERFSAALQLFVNALGHAATAP